MPTPELRAKREAGASKETLERLDHCLVKTILLEHQCGRAIGQLTIVGSEFRVVGTGGNYDFRAKDVEEVTDYMERRPTITLKEWAETWQEAFLQAHTGDHFHLHIYLETEDAPPLFISVMGGELIPYVIGGWYSISNWVDCGPTDIEHFFCFSPGMVMSVSDKLMTIHI